MTDYFADKSVSQSFLARFNDCPMSGLLYARHREDPRGQSHAQARGEIYHSFWEWFVAEQKRAGEAPPPDVAREQIEEICDQRTDLVIPHHERDALRGMAWNTAVEALPLYGEVQTEVEVEFKVAGWTIKGRIDRVDEQEREAWIQDAKTSLAPPSQESFEKQLQLPLYAAGWFAKNPRLDRIHVAAVFPRFLSKRCELCETYNDGHAESCKECGGAQWGPSRLMRRRMTIEKRDAHDLMRSIEGSLRKLEINLASGLDEWPASPGSHCSTCPCQPECPLPAHELPFFIADEEEAARAAENRHRLKAVVADLNASLKEWASEEGEIFYGDQRLGFTEIIDKNTGSTSTRFDNTKAAA